MPFEEDDKDPSVWFLDHTYIDDMNTMFKKINGNFWTLPLSLIIQLEKRL